LHLVGRHFQFYYDARMHERHEEATIFRSVETCLLNYEASYYECTFIYIDILLGFRKY